MAAMILLALPVIAFVTALISGMFGMAGGLLLMGALALLLPVGAAFVTHGLIQMVSNGSRAFFNRRDIIWPIVGWHALASAIAGVAFAGVSFVPSERLVFLLLGIVGVSVWFPPRWFALDARRPSHAFASGLLVTGTNLLAGVAGALLDIFFVRTSLTRHQIVATKALTQVFAHLAKVLVYGFPLLLAARDVEPPWLAIAICVPFTLVGTRLGKTLLDRMRDPGFLGWTKWIVTAIGAAYLARAVLLYFD